MDIKRVQACLKREGVEGWLLYDFRRSNDLACNFLGIGADRHLTRRFFYWIPAVGEPVAIAHVIEPHVLQGLPGKVVTYGSWQELEGRLAEVLKGKKVVAMEYSPRNAIPYVSKVDGGTLEQVRGCGVEVVSSAPFLQAFTSVWTGEQLQMHREAAMVLEEVAAKTWEWIARRLGSMTEYDVQQFMFEEICKRGCVMEGLPICAVGANSANPHYSPTKEGAKKVGRGDFILLDLWCKKDQPMAVYADITRVGVADQQPTAKQREVFEVVRRAQAAATDFVSERFGSGQALFGFEVDRKAREVIEKSGYGAYFTHRTGHNIGEETHGSGTHLDDFETHDTRPLIAGTCFSVEPGIYLPGEFGVRLEYDVYLGEEGRVQVTGGVQEGVKSLIP